MPSGPHHHTHGHQGLDRTVSNDQLGLTERDESTHYPVFMHLWAINLPSGIRAVLRSDAAQSRWLLKATTKNERKRQPRLDQATTHGADQTTSTASAGKLRTASPTRPSLPIRCLQVTRFSLRLRAKRRRTQLCALCCGDEMCELFAESLSATEEDISHQNLSNAFRRIAMSYHIGNTLELCLTEEELGRVGLSCHFAVDCLCDNWYMPFEPGDTQ